MRIDEKTRERFCEWQQSAKLSIEFSIVCYRWGCKMLSKWKQLARTQ